MKETPDNASELERILQHALRHVDYPTPAELKRHAQDRLPMARRQEIDWYLATSQAVRDEYALIQKLYATQTRTQTVPSNLRRTARTLIEAVLRRPTLGPAAVRGDILSYETPAVSIILSPGIDVATRHKWSLAGKIVRTGQAEVTLEHVHLTAQHTNTLATQNEIAGAVSGNSEFAFALLDPGVYDLVILTSHQDILIRSLQIGTPKSSEDDLF